MSSRDRASSPADIGRREVLRLGLTAGPLLVAGGLLMPEEAWARRKKSARDTAKKSVLTGLAGAVEKEHRAIWAYRAAIGTGKLPDELARLATAFLAQHREHAAGLATAMQKMGGTPPGPRSTYDLTAFNPDLATEKGILLLALKLESDAVKAYHEALGMLKDPGLRGISAGIFADEAMHVAVWRSALGFDPVPVAFVTDPTTWSLS